MKWATGVLFSLSVISIPYLHNLKTVDARTPTVAQNQPTCYCQRLYPPGATIADKFYWVGAEKNLGVTFTGKFNSAQKMAETFNLAKEIGSFKGKKWKLSDILLAVDFGGNGNVATWQVSGPTPLVQKYLNDLKAQYANKSVFYDFSASTIKFTVSAD